VDVRKFNVRWHALTA